MKNVFTGWHFMRVIRLLLGMFIFISSLYRGGWPIAIMGLLFAGMTIINIGCCCGPSCYAPIAPPAQKSNHDIQYEEVLTDK